jgi:Capsular polysaccharide biosynthesis protein
MKKKSSFFDRFASKKTAIEAGFLNGLTDIHSHYLPGVDDGFQTAEETAQALNAMIKQGVRRVYFTPHVMADIPENRPAFLQKRFADFQKEAPAGIELRLAAEYMLDVGFYGQQEDGLLTLGDKHVLIEMSYLSPSPELIHVIYDLQLKGYIPLLAHPERYLFMDQTQYCDLKAKGCKYQLNLMSLSGQYGERAQDVAWFLLQKGLYDFVGSDIHRLNVFLHHMNRLKLTLKEQNLLQSLIRQNDLLW